MENDNLVELKEQQYDSESLLQELLEKYPNLISGEQIDTSAPRKWWLIAREAGVSSSDDGGDRWYIDHLFLDQDGIPTLVEVKRSTDTRIRREVVGQMLDYAANAILYWPVEKIRYQFESNNKDKDSNQILREFIGPGMDVNSFWDKVKTNLQAGRIRLIFVADRIPLELKRIIEFLNQQMDPAEVLGFEIPKYEGKGVKALVPKIVGRTAVSENRKNREEQQWDEPSFIKDITIKRGLEEAVIAQKIINYSKNKGLRLDWGYGKADGSFYPVFDYNYISYWMIGVWSSGYIEFQFQHMKSRPPFDKESKRIELIKLLNVIEGIKIPLDSNNRRPNIPLAILNSKNNYSKFENVMDWYLQEVKNYVKDKQN
jgi:hypothetical protein